jgi:hypothetical protein
MTEKLNNKLRKFLSKPRLTPIGDEISQECNDIFGSAKGSQISETF